MPTIRLQKLFLSVFFFLLLVSTTAQTESALLEKLAAAQHDSDRADVYVDLHNAVYKTDISKAEAYAEKVVLFGKSSGVDRFQLTGFRALARCGRKTRNYPLILHYDSLAMAIAKKINTPIAIFTMDMDFASDYLDGKMPADAVSHLNNAEKIASEQNNNAWQAKVQNRLGWFYAAQYQHTQAIPHFEKALAAYEKLGDQKMINETKQPYAESLIAIGKTEKVPELLFGAIDYFRKANALSYLGYSLTLTGQSYFKNGNMEKALEYFFEAKKNTGHL